MPLVPKIYKVGDVIEHLGINKIIDKILYTENGKKLKFLDEKETILVEKLEDNVIKIIK